MSAVPVQRTRRTATGHSARRMIVWASIHDDKEGGGGMAYVRDVMKKDPIVAKSTDRIQQISKILTEKNISNMPVVDGKGDLVGIISEQDIIRAMGSEDFLKKQTKDVMTKNVLTVQENDCLEYVSKLFIEHPFRRLPVVRNKKVIGVITREDIISTFMSNYY